MYHFIKFAIRTMLIFIKIATKILTIGIFPKFPIKYYNIFYACHIIIKEID